MDERLTARFLADGWVLIRDAVDVDTVKAVQERLQGVFPTEDEFRAAPDRYPWASDGQFGGLRLWPIDDRTLDLLPLDMRVVAVAEHLLQASDIRLRRAGYQAKYAGTVDFTQVLHYDYQNHRLVVPAGNDIVGFFLYLSDVSEDLGPTMLVSDLVSGPVAPDKTHLSRDDEPQLYEHERSGAGPAGSLLAYRSTTYHRGSAIVAQSGVRLTLGFAYGRPAPWTGYVSFPRLGEERGLINAVVAASPRQREILGFPGVGNPFWTPDTAAAVARRYPGFDPAPYL